MTLEDEVKQLKKELEDIKLGRDVVFTESLRRRLLQNVVFAGITSTSLADINETTVVAAVPGNVIHAEAFDKKVKVNIDGSDYWLGLYNT